MLHSNPIPDSIPENLKPLLKQFLQSGSSELITIAQLLITVADSSNSESEHQTSDLLIASAEEIKTAAEAVITVVSRRVPVYQSEPIPKKRTPDLHPHKTYEVQTDGYSTGQGKEYFVFEKDTFVGSVQFDADKNQYYLWFNRTGLTYGDQRVEPVFRSLQECLDWLP
ncbi:hypothetical protein ACQ4M3_24265 [Leptolyngbya sp. AN03gr2]|uniref:hypothetical protein n=1 Tax=unclassified Leptolyngbya TaxID=2650499 RepID=UPI003D31FB3E